MAGLILLPISLALSAFSEHESGDLQHAASWNEHEVARWLSTLQLERYSDAFVASNIDGEALIELSEQNLLELGVDSAAHRKLLLHAALAFAHQQMLLAAAALFVFFTDHILTENRL